MKKRTTILLIAFTILYLINVSCNKNTGACEDASTIENSAGLELHIKDTILNRFIYDKSQPLYNIDSLQIWNSQGKQFKPYIISAADTTDFYRAYYAIGIYGLYDNRYDENMYNDTIRKDIYIRYKSNLLDTLNISFKAKIGQCGSEFAFLQVMYRKKIISNTQYEFIPHFIIKK